MTSEKCEDCVRFDSENGECKSNYYYKQPSNVLMYEDSTGYTGCSAFEPKMVKNSDVAIDNEQKGSPKTAINYLNECVEVQKQRGEQYDNKGSGERSFAACAASFNAKTGYDLKGSHICLILQDLKDVRQYSDPTRLHEDSVLDKVSYASLHAEELNKELTK